MDAQHPPDRANYLQQACFQFRQSLCGMFDNCCPNVTSKHIFVWSFGLHAATVLMAIFFIARAANHGVPYVSMLAFQQLLFALFCVAALCNALGLRHRRNWESESDAAFQASANFLLFLFLIILFPISFAATDITGYNLAVSVGTNLISFPATICFSMIVYKKCTEVDIHPPILYAQV
jgi:hypothetical protein